MVPLALKNVVTPAASPPCIIGAPAPPPRLGRCLCLARSTKSVPITPGPIDLRGAVPFGAAELTLLCRRVLIASGALGGSIEEFEEA
jgi:hypothetical protein